MNFKLRQIRNEKNVAVSSLIELLGISSATYYKKELGYLRFSLNEAKALADYFQLDIKDIFFDAGVSKSETI